MTKREGERTLYRIKCMGCGVDMDVENPEQPPYCVPCFVGKSMQERYSVQKEFNENELLEKFAEICHDQWVYWSLAVFKQLLGVNNVDVAEQANKLYDKWSPNWKPYHQLSEEMKEIDRNFARKFLEVIKK